MIATMFLTLAHWLAIASAVCGIGLAIALNLTVPAVALYFTCRFFWKRMTATYDLAQLRWLIGEMRRQGRLRFKIKGDQQ